MNITPRVTRTLCTRFSSSGRSIPVDMPRYTVPASIESKRSQSRRFTFEYPGTNPKHVATYLLHEYPGWKTWFLPDLDVNNFQRKTMFLKECEAAIFAQDPREYDPRELGFTEFSRVPALQVKLVKQKPTHFVNYHDLCEMYKRRQYIDLPYVNVGSYVEVNLRSRYDFARSVTYRGLVTEKEHSNLNGYFVVRQNVSNGQTVENFIHMYSPWLNSVKVLSYQVRNDRSGHLHSLRDLSYEQSTIPDVFPDPVHDPKSGLEIPLFAPLSLEFRRDTRAQRRHQHSKHLVPNERRESLRELKMWETDPTLKYFKNTLKKDRITK